MPKRTSSRVLWSISIALLLVIVAVIAFTTRSAQKPAVTLSSPASLPGLMTSEAPWPANHTNLRARLTALGLPALTAEGSRLHTHEHLDLFVNGQTVPVPANIGNEEPTFISPLHTHDTSGVIHIESPRVQTFTLGQFFDVWGLRFTKDALGGYTTNASSSLAVYVNGTRYTGDPRLIPLTEHEEIAVVYGTPPKTIPSSYAFPAGE